jgi:hypothetical protein
MEKHLHKKEPKHPVPSLPDDSPKDPEDNPTAPPKSSPAIGDPHPKYGLPMTRGMVKRYRREHGEV